MSTEETYTIKGLTKRDIAVLHVIMMRVGGNMEGPRSVVNNLLEVSNVILDGEERDLLRVGHCDSGSNINLDANWDCIDTAIKTQNNQHVFEFHDK